MFDTKVEDLIQTLAVENNRVEKRFYLENYDKESVSIYFVTLQDDFQTIKRVIQSISGCMILVQGRNLHDVSSLLTFTKQYLDETTEKVWKLSAPRGLEQHFGNLKGAIRILNNLFTTYSLAQDANYLTKKQVTEIINILKVSYENLKKASSFSAGMEMVSLESSCACGLH